MLRLLLTNSGWKRAEVIKKAKVFYRIGESCYYHPFRLPAEPHLVSLGDNVFIGTDVLLITHNMFNCVLNRKDNRSLKFIPQVGRIKIGNNVFIGAKAIIMYGVEIGNNCVIAAGSIVTKDVADGTVVAGVPARKIGTFDEQIKKCEMFNEIFVNKMKNKNLTLWEKQKDFFWNDEC